jgi:hypothetical protein
MSQEEHNRQIHHLDRKMKGRRTTLSGAAKGERPKSCAAPGPHIGPPRGTFCSKRLDSRHQLPCVCGVKTQPSGDDQHFCIL